MSTGWYIFLPWSPRNAASCWVLRFIVHPKPGFLEPLKYDGELSIIINDWWHNAVHEQELGLFSKEFRWVGEPQSLLIEGRGAYNCSLVPTGAVPNSGDCGIIKLHPCGIGGGHNMTVVEADGHYVEPVEVDNLDVYSGESFSVLFTANQDASRFYWAGINVRGRNPKTPSGLAILNYLPNSPTMRPTTPAPVSPLWNDFALSLS
ncbi:hypothetical protein Mapa_014512 [Marchantia paleacea]|nr:hypothetical protein Mapa_014512 [Marchantia paleacea]